MVGRRLFDANSRSADKYAKSQMWFRKIERRSKFEISICATELYVSTLQNKIKVFI
jgi:hypothetical protein